MRILILGATGLLGKDIVKTFSTPDFRLITPDRTMLQAFYGILTDAWYVDLDFAEKMDRIKELVHTLKPDVVINCIGYTNVDAAEDNTEVARVINGEFPTLLAEVCQNFNCDLVHVSTDYVFGRPDQDIKRKFKEEDYCSAVNVYGVTKRLGEMGVKEYSFPGCYVVRTSWLFGSGKKNWLDLALEPDGKYFDLHRLTFGTPTYTLDLAYGIKQIVTTRPREGIYHVANDTAQPVTKLEMIHYARFQAGLGPPLVEISAQVKARRPHNTALDIEKFKVVYEMPNVHNAITRYLKEIGRYAPKT